MEDLVTEFLGREEFPKTRFRAKHSWPPASPASGPAIDRRHFFVATSSYTALLYLLQPVQLLGLIFPTTLLPQRDSNPMNFRIKNICL